MSLHSFPLHQPRVVQGFFLGGQPRIPAPPRQGGAVQASPRAGFAVPLPATIQLGRAGAGQRLPEAVQRKMEAAFKTDFSDVRVHVGPEAAAIGAAAFTFGSNLYFAPGQYNPGLPHGQRLLGHELAHVVQQREGRVRNPLGSGIAVVQDPGLEAEAERRGLQAAMAPVPAPRVAASRGAVRPVSLQPSRPGGLRPPVRSVSPLLAAPPPRQRPVAPFPRAHAMQPSPVRFPSRLILQPSLAPLPGAWQAGQPGVIQCNWWDTLVSYVSNKKTYYQWLIRLQAVFSIILIWATLTTEDEEDANKSWQFILAAINVALGIGQSIWENVSDDLVENSLSTLEKSVQSIGKGLPSLTTFIAMAAAGKIPLAWRMVLAVVETLVQTFVHIWNAGSLDNYRNLEHSLRAKIKNRQLEFDWKGALTLETSELDQIVGYNSV